jgi:hypothetical protein
MDISNCCICGDDFNDVMQVVIVKHANDHSLLDSRKRGHYFHKNCLDEWKKQQCTCPLDRDPIARTYTVPGYQIVGFELGLYDYDYYKVITDLKVTDVLLEQINVNDIDKNNRTLAFYACKIGNHALVTRLLKKGANFNQSCGNNQFTPLMVAICYNHSCIVSKLLSNKKVTDNINVYDGTGTTAFGYACQYKRCDIISDFLTRKLVPHHQVLYYLDMYRTNFNADKLYGTEIISKLCHYLKSDV